MARGFRWKLGSYVGGDTAVHQSYKPYLVLEPGQNISDIRHTGGEILIQPRDTTNIVVSGLGFQPDVLLFVSYRPRYHADQADSDFGHRGGGFTFGAASATCQFTGSTRIKQGFDSNTGRARWREDACHNVISIDRLTSGSPTIDILTLELLSLDANGFTLAQTANLYDQTDYVAWLALKGDFQLGVINSGTTSIRGFPGTPTGAVFLSIKNDALVVYPYWSSIPTYNPGDIVQHNGLTYIATSLNTNDEPPSANWSLYAPASVDRATYWDHMQGFASVSSQAVIWGGGRPSSWNWTTERWEDDAAILFCTPANGSSFIGTSVDQKAVASFVSGGVDLTWDIDDGLPHRIGFLLADPAEAGVIETNWETRPGGTQVDFPDGSNWVPTTFIPEVVLMTGTNYNFGTSNTDPMDMPRSAGAFWAGGGGGLGWHWSPFVESGTDAIGVHTYGNAVAELGHYSNSGTIYARGCIMAGQGANSNPPAPHQHCVNIIPNPLQPGLNWRYADRRLTSNRLLHG